MAEATAIKYIGQPLRRREDFKFVTGKGRYTDDLKVPGMLHMAVLRSPHAHAIIKQVDLSAATAAPGVRLALSGADLAGKIGSIVPNWIMPGTKVPDRPVVAIDRVRFVGECVALVVAESQAMAHDAIAFHCRDFASRIRHDPFAPVNRHRRIGVIMDADEINEAIRAVSGRRGLGLEHDAIHRHVKFRRFDDLRRVHSESF